MYISYIELNESEQNFGDYTAAPRQKGITDNFVKIELSQLPGPE